MLLTKQSEDLRVLGRIRNSQRRGEAVRRVAQPPLQAHAAANLVIAEQEQVFLSRVERELHKLLPEKSKLQLQLQHQHE